MPLLLLRSKRQQGPIPALLPRDFNDNKPHKIRKSPVTAMCAQHVEVLDIQRPAAAREKVVDLAIIVEEEHAFFSDFLAGEIVCFEFNV